MRAGINTPLFASKSSVLFVTFTIGGRVGEIYYRYFHVTLTFSVSNSFGRYFLLTGLRQSSFNRIKLMSFVVNQLSKRIFTMQRHPGETLEYKMLSLTVDV